MVKQTWSAPKELVEERRAQEEGEVVVNGHGCLGER